MMIAIRRFAARPSGVLFEAIGTSAPWPLASTRLGWLRAGLIRAVTALARSTESWKFEEKRAVFTGMSSVWPTILIAPGCRSRTWATRAISGLKLSLSFASSGSKSGMFERRMTMLVGVSRHDIGAEIPAQTLTRCTVGGGGGGGGAGTRRWILTSPAG